jgi:hypothetical protein
MRGLIYVAASAKLDAPFEWRCFVPDYSLIIRGLRHPGSGLPGVLVRDLLDAVDHGARGAVRLRLEGRSRAGGGPPPAWVADAATFDFVGLIEGEDGVTLRIPTLRETLPERFVQHDLFPIVAAADTALSLFGQSLHDALGGNMESDAYDEPLLSTFAEEFKQVFRHGVEAVEMRNGRPGARALNVTPAGIQVVERLKRQTPRPRRVRLAGTVDAIRHSDRAFTLVLATGEQVRGVLTEGAPEELAAYFGRIAIVSGAAQFRPSGALLRVDADHLAAAEEEDLRMWSVMPEPLDVQPNPRAVRQPQGPRSGINAIFGKWPGDETDEEIFQLLEEMS